MSECIDHGARGDKDGYLRTTRANKSVFVHRVIYCLANQLTIEQIDGLIVRHTCDNPRCINPDHLIGGTHAENMQDKALRGRVPNRAVSYSQAQFIKENCKPSTRGKHSSLESKEWSYSALAKRFGISVPSVRAIHRGYTYKTAHQDSHATGSTS